MARTSQEDPLKVFRFTLDIGGAKVGFSEISGLERETEVAEYREGGDNETPKKSPGLSKFNDLTLKRGQTLDEGQNDFYGWASQVHNAVGLGIATENFRRDPELVQYDRMGRPAVRWRIHNAWPKRFKATGDFSGNSNDNSIEELVLTYEGFEKVPV